MSQASHEVGPLDMTDTVSRPTILVVENDEETRRLYADILGAMGADILEAGNPYEAFEHLRSRPVALVVTDLGMPGGGLDYLKNLRVAACPILAITGLSGARLRHDAITAGATEFLEKPIRTKQLREAIARLLPHP